MLSDTVNFIIKGWTVTGRNGEVTGLASGACGFVSLGPEQSCRGRHILPPQCFRRFQTWLTSPRREGYILREEARKCSRKGFVLVSGIAKAPTRTQKNFLQSCMIFFGQQCMS